MSDSRRPSMFAPVNLPKTGGPAPFARGMGDYMEPGYRAILDGSARQQPPGLLETGPAVPGADQSLVDAILAAFAQIIARYGGIPTREVRFDTFTARAIVVGVNPILLDEPLRRERRAVTIINTHPANQLWFSSDQTVAVNDGGFLSPNGGNISLPVNENCRIYGVSNGAGTVVSVVQYA